MKEILLDLWEFADAPDNLKSLLPLPHPGGWLAYIYPECEADVAQMLIDRWCSLGLSLARYQLEGGGIVLAGQHPPYPLRKRLVE